MAEKMTAMQTPMQPTLQERIDAMFQVEREKRETTDFIETIKNMTESEMQQMRGIVVGMRLAQISAVERM